VPILLFATPLVSNAVTPHFFHTFDLFSYKHGPFFVGSPRPSMRHRNFRKPEHEKLSDAEHNPLPDEVSFRAESDRGRRVRSILSRKNLSLLQVSVASAQMFGADTPYHVPHNLYYDLRNRQFTPNLYQFIALSSISGYRLTDWLSALGFDLENIVRLQVELQFPKTILLDANLYDIHAVIPWFEQKGPGLGTISPFTQVVSQNLLESVDTLVRSNKKAFLYAKLGCEDTFSFPELMPGSVVRVNPRRDSVKSATLRGGVSREFFLLEHAQGLNCCRIRQVGPSHIAIASLDRTVREFEFRLDREVRILGTVDMELRRFENRSGSRPPRIPTKLRTEDALMSITSAGDLRHLIASQRRRNGLSFRQASTMSGLIATKLGDDRYSAAIGSLSDYEATETPPRHLQKVLTLCILYSIDFWQFLRTARLATNQLGVEPIPGELIPRLPAAPRSGDVDIEGKALDKNAFHRDLIEQFEEVPYFLHGALSELCRMPRISIRDVFWVGSRGHDFQWPLRGAVLLVVNRRIKRPMVQESKADESRHIYLLTQRDGSYFCGQFRRDGCMAPLHSTSGPAGQRALALGSEAEIAGEVVTCLRWVELPG